MLHVHIIIVTKVTCGTKLIVAEGMIVVEESSRHSKDLDGAENSE